VAALGHSPKDTWQTHAVGRATGLALRWSFHQARRPLPEQLAERLADRA